MNRVQIDLLNMRAFGEREREGEEERERERERGEREREREKWGIPMYSGVSL